MSRYIKPGTVTWIKAMLWQGTAENGITVWFNVASTTKGSVATTTGATHISSGITSEANGWKRIYITGIPRNTPGSVFTKIDVVNEDNASAYTTVSGRFYGVWGAVLSRGAVLYNYDAALTTTTTAVYTPRYVTGKSGQAILIEEASTNVFLNSQGTAAVTQSIAVTTANSGKWTVSVFGAGTVTTSAGTATASGYGVASVGTPNTITVTANGTVAFTVAGATANTIINVENLPYATSPIVTGSSPTTRAAETLTYPTAGVLTPEQGTILKWVYVDTAKQGSNKAQYFFGHKNTNNVINLYKTTTPNQYTAELSNNAGATSNHTVTLALSVGWNQIGMSWDANRLDLILNGIEQASPVATPNLPESLASTFNSGSNTTGANQENVPSDNERIYSRKLTAAEILKLYQMGR